MKWIGKSVPRQEDALLTAGAGRYLADIELPGLLHMAVLRSPHAHARIVSVDTEAAKNHPGVHAVLTEPDLPGYHTPLPVIWRMPGQQVDAVRTLARGKVRYVGEPVAI